MHDKKSEVKARSPGEILNVGIVAEKVIFVTSARNPRNPTSRRVNPRWKNQKRSQPSQTAEQMLPNQIPTRRGRVHGSWMTTTMSLLLLIILYQIWINFLILTTRMTRKHIRVSKIGNLRNPIGFQILQMTMMRMRLPNGMKT